MPTKKTTHVVPNPNGGWDIKQGGASKSFGHFPAKASAIDRARKISQHRRSELYIHKKDGTIGQKDSHGGDPFPPRG